MFDYVNHIIKVLKKAQQTNPILTHFLIKYPSKQIMQSNNCIYVGFSEAKATSRTHHSQDYDELIDIIITTKQLDYFECSKILKVVSNLILHELRKDDIIHDKISPISFMYKYNSDNTLKFGELLISCNTTENYNDVFDIEDDDLVYDIVCSIKGYVGENDGKEER